MTSNLRVYDKPQVSEGVGQLGGVFACLTCEICTNANCVRTKVKELQPTQLALQRAEEMLCVGSRREILRQVSMEDKARFSYAMLRTWTQRQGSRSSESKSASWELRNLGQTAFASVSCL